MRSADMADLYYADFSSMDVEELIKKYEDKVDSQRLSKITRTRADEARVRSLLAGYLLQIAVKDYLGIENKEQVLDLKYNYGIHGKPYLTDFPNFYFNISHSGNLVVCAISKHEIGVDVQQHVQMKEQLAKRFFTEEECLMLTAQENREAYERLFFRLFCIKESYIKYTGRGMSQGLDSFKIDLEKKEISDGKRHGNVPDAVFEEIKLKGKADVSLCVCMAQREEIILKGMDI